MRRTSPSLVDRRQKESMTLRGRRMEGFSQRIGFAMNLACSGSLLLIGTSLLATSVSAFGEQK